MEKQDEDVRATKLALARKKLKDHQEKKFVATHKEEINENTVLLESLVHDNNNINAKCSTDDNFHESEVMNTHQVLVNQKIENNGMDMNVTEMLISNKTKLESQVTELETKLSLLATTHNLEINGHNATKQQVYYLQNELKHMNDKYESAMENIQQLGTKIEELTSVKVSLHDENNNLIEQLEFTKTILTAKESENMSLRNHLEQLQNELDVTKLQLQQLNNGLNMSVGNSISNSYSEQIETLLQKSNNLEHQLNITQKEKDQINSHYENYVRELNEQLKSIMMKNDELSKKVQNLSIRENSLIEQISDMEIRLQNINIRKVETVEIQHNGQDYAINNDMKDLQEKFSKTQDELQQTKSKLMELQQLYIMSESKVNELQEVINSNSTHDAISISKLTEDIASDKIAAQRATEQNKKLKISMQELEEAFVKMSQDKLELTEKLSAEKYLNRELTIKLAEIDENSKSIHTKLMAKDEEMIRLQTTFRDLKRELDQQSVKMATNCDSIHSECSEGHDKNKNDPEAVENENEERICDDHEHENIIKNERSQNIPQEDAMLKLQERFMKIMGEVADLSDEKHRLEHIILQLQNETDTICEYVALYQQQRSLLKKRDEERSAQIQLFQVECDRLKNQLEELSGILLKFAEDTELANYFQVEARKNDMDKVRTLLLNLKSNTLVDPKNNLELSNVYPCNCCSGNLIDI